MQKVRQGRPSWFHREVCNAPKRITLGAGFCRLVGPLPDFRRSVNRSDCHPFTFPLGAGFVCDLGGSSGPSLGKTFGEAPGVVYVKLCNYRFMAEAVIG